MASRGLFITFEGMDGSGKTTQMHRLAERLRGMGRTVLETVEPGGSPIAMKIRHILLDAANQELSPVAEVLLYFASRAQNVDEWIAPALSRGEIVLSDRFNDSSLVYQGGGRELGAEAVAALERIACRGVKPDLTVLVDVDAEASLACARARNDAAPHCETRMDDQSLEFHRKVYAAYHALAEAEPGPREGGRRARRYRHHRAPGLEHRGAVCLTISWATRTPAKRWSRRWLRTPVADAALRRTRGTWQSHAGAPPRGAAVGPRGLD